VPITDVKQQAQLLELQGSSLVQISSYVAQGIEYIWPEGVRTTQKLTEQFKKLSYQPSL
jgi:hypothetical protein